MTDYSTTYRSANFSLTSCLEDVLCGERLGLATAATAEGISLTLLLEESPLLEALTGRYPSLECFSKYFFDLNLFFSNLVKSRMSSPEVVCKKKMPS